VTTTRPTAVAMPGPSSTDTDLVTWQAHTNDGALPAPDTPRWQVLRAGVVNLWEFDVAEYWFAGGRAQLVGKNQSGKSTLMALTTLILLAGNLDRDLIDTFGQHHKAFRYYIEPTDDPTDRRPTDTGTNRGWAWMEYGRLDETGAAHYYTLLLYAQSRRGTNDFARKWATCNSGARVGAELPLHIGAATATPADLTDVPGYADAPNGTDYKDRIARDLFGFADTSQLDTAVRMLKLLRTPQLGQKLDPGFFTAQMRQALPAVSRTEIDQLADGWDQLEQLAVDTADARAARDGVKSYVQRAWNPWADAVLRRSADELVASNTAFDAVTRKVREATTALQDAQAQADQLGAEAAEASRSKDTADTRYDQLLHSQAYRSATDARNNVTRLKQDAATKAAAKVGADTDRSSATERVRGREQRAATAEQILEDREVDLNRAMTATATAATAAGLPDAATAWARTPEISRLHAALTTRRGHVRAAQDLVTAAATATQHAENDARQADRTAAQRNARSTTKDNATSELAHALQTLSDALETWATGAGSDAPATAMRDAWVAAVTEESSSRKPRAVLSHLVTSQWLEPLLEPLREQVAAAKAHGRAHAARARDLDAQADERAGQTDPTPATPTLWTQRPRPAHSPCGAPLWRLVDPTDTLPGPDLDHIEAALAAAGLLDAWVTPDGAYLPDRDTIDTVVTLTGPEPQGLTLSDVLRPAADAGNLTGTTAAILSHIGLGTTPEAATFISTDGTWRHGDLTGQVTPAPAGAALIGTAARAAARARHVAQLRAQAETAREEAATATTEANQVQALIADLNGHTPPADDAVVHDAIALRNAERELTAAISLDEPAQAKAVTSRVAADDATSALLSYATGQSVPHTTAQLRDVTAAIDAAITATSDLSVAFERHRATAEQLTTATTLLDEARRDLREAEAKATAATTAAARAHEQATSAEGALGASDQELLTQELALRSEQTQLATLIQTLNKAMTEHATRVAIATAALDMADESRTAASADREDTLTRYWHLIDQGLAALRGLAAPTERLITHALAHAQTVRRNLNPPNWPTDTADARTKAARVEAATSKMSGTALTELRQTLEARGGRTATLVDGDETTLAQVRILVDGTGNQVNPIEAVRSLDKQAADLARLHDEKMQEVLVELLSSTFVEHLRERLGQVVKLIHQVNDVLSAYPHGADHTTMRLTRVAPEGRQAAYDVLDALEGQFVDSPDVQTQVRSFLEAQIRTAQDLGRTGPQSWKDHLADQLDYRSWFDVIAQTRVPESRWRPLTREMHAKDSGGGKVLTFLQPLLATLVALYNECPTAPRPLWLDEAFMGVDDANRSAMFAMLVRFDLDFLLAGPDIVVADSRVPAAAIWFVTRAPAPIPGVDLAMMLWAGNELRIATIPTGTLTEPRAKDGTTDPSDDLFATVTA